MIDYHTHNGIDSPKLKPVDLEGFPIFSAQPTSKSAEGTFALEDDGTYKYLWVKLNKVWNLFAVSPAYTGTGNNLSVGALTVGAGQPVTKIISSTAVLNFGAIAPEASADLTMTLTGALNADSVIIGVDNGVIGGGVNCGNVVFFAWVSATNTITIRCLNNDSALTANPASGTFRATIIQF